MSVDTVNREPVYALYEDPMDSVDYKFPRVSPAEKRKKVAIVAGAIAAIEVMRLVQETKRGEATLKSTLAKAVLGGLSATVSLTAWAHYNRFKSEEIETAEISY